MTATRLHKIAEACWYGNSGLSLVLLPIAWLYGLVIRLRRNLYRVGLFAAPESPVPVVVVGNIVVGGTGKTPVVAWLVSALRERGYSPAIVSRGYGGSSGAQPRRVKVTDDPAVVGDEPLLLARLTGAEVVVSADRVAAVQMAADGGADIVIADDGLQHYRMQRVFEIVVADGARGFGNGRLLPAGPLREPLARLAEVDIVLVNGGVSGDNNAIAGTPFELQQQDPVTLDGTMSRPLTDFRGLRVWSVAGIGNPQRFHGALQAAGLVVDSVEVADHGRIDLTELARSRTQPVFMTAKDAVKYSPVHDVEVWVVPATVGFATNTEAELLARLQDKLNGK